MLSGLSEVLISTAGSQAVDGIRISGAQELGIHIFNKISSSTAGSDLDKNADMASLPCDSMHRVVVLIGITRDLLKILVSDSPS